MFETYLRPTYQKYLVDPIAVIIANKLSPASITLLGALLGLLTAPFLLGGYGKIACGLLLVSGYFDTLDGTLARKQNTISAKGSMLDIVCDRLVEFAVIAGLFGVAPATRGWLAIGMLGSVLLCVTTFLVVAIFTENNSQKSFYYSPGIIERPEAFFFFSLMILLPAFFNLLAVIFIFLVSITALIRMRQFLHSY